MLLCVVCRNAEPGRKAMAKTTSFGDVLEAADKLSLDEQEALLDVLHRRLVEHRREQIAREVRQARDEFQGYGCGPATPADLMKEILK